MAGAGRDLADVVRLRPQLDLSPDRLHSRGDDGILLLLQHIRDLLRQLGRLPAQQIQLRLCLIDLHLQVRHRLLLLCLQCLQL